jgi:hypothetical protein
VNYGYINSDIRKVSLQKESYVQFERIPEYRKSLWTQKQKVVSFVVVLPSPLYCIFDSKV